MMFACFGAQQGKQKNTSSFRSLKPIRLNSSDHFQGPVPYSVSEIWQATDNFSPSRRIGQGGFGTVYLGTLKDGTSVAVKRAKKASFDGRVCSEFKSELDTLTKVEHANLVRLMGYLECQNERVLVMEYVPNGNLREHLDGLRGQTLSFKTRMGIIIDVAHALTYLHCYADEPIIHRDVKASNILLTQAFRAKVTDFGFSKVGPENDATHVSTQVKGTAGYLDPEYLYSRQLTDKSDVYSFGILMVEILSGRRPIEVKRTSDERVTIRWAWKKYEENKMIEILDPNMPWESHMIRVLDSLVQLALSCAAPNRKERPSIREVTESLCKIRRNFQTSFGTTSSSGSFFTSSDSLGSERINEHVNSV